MAQVRISVGVEYFKEANNMNITRDSHGDMLAETEFKAKVIKWTKVLETVTIKKKVNKYEKKPAVKRTTASMVDNDLDEPQEFHSEIPDDE